MAKMIQVTAEGNPVYIPSESVLKVTGTTSTVVLTYIGGETATLTSSGTSLVEADAQASFYASILECINAGPDAAGVVVNTYFADYEDGVS